MIGALLTSAFLVSIAIAGMFSTYLAGKSDGYTKGRNECARELMHMRVTAAAEGAVLSIEDFAKHCHTTVVSTLYGTPDWWTHIVCKKAGECGEFMEHVGKASRDDGWSIFKGVGALTPERRMSLIKEIGDGWWYDIMILRELASSAREAMLVNITKREGRKERGTLQGAGDNR